MNHITQRDSSTNYSLNLFRIATLMVARERIRVKKNKELKITHKVISLLVFKIFQSHTHPLKFKVFS